MKQKLKLKQEQKKKEKQEQKLNAKQKVALHALQKQLQVLKLKEWLVVIGFIFGGALLRVPMQAVPNAEPITFFAILAGWLFGRKKGFLVGASSGYLSSFITYGGIGPWTIFQVIGWGIAGFLGGFIKDIKPSKNYFTFWLSSIIPVLTIATLGTLIFQIIMNASWALFAPFSIFALFLSGLPFLLIHVVSNIIFSLFLPFARKVVYEKGKFNEMDVCNSIINRINNSPKLGRLLPWGKTEKQ